MSAATVGVFGGTFDPVHLGHLHVASEVRRIFRLPAVHFVPCSDPPHKTRELSPARHRVAMLRLAIEGRAGLAVSTIELERGGVSFTIETLRAYRGGPSPQDPLFVLGMDALLEIEGWHRHRQLLDEFDLLVVDRPGDDSDRALAALGEETRARVRTLSGETGAADRIEGPPAGNGGRIFHVAIRPRAVSSSLVRSLAATGRPLDGLVPAAVGRYIREHGLYRKEGGAR